MSKVAAFLFLMTSILFGLLACAAIPQMPHEGLVGDDFFKSDRSDRRQRFHRLTPDQQLDIYLYGMNEIHPPVMGLASEFAAPPSFMETRFVYRLLESGDDDAVHLILLLKAFVCKKDATFALGVALSSALRERSERLSDVDDKRLAQEMRAQIDCCTRDNSKVPRCSDHSRGNRGQTTFDFQPAR